jgi:plastocyanin domain-containing protein
MRVAVLLVIAAVACGKKSDDAAAPPTPVVRAGADGIRHVAVRATKDGYLPPRIAGKPNEKLVLEVTREQAGDCLEHVVMPDKRDIVLPLNKMVEIPVTVPGSGEVTFACGMDMFKGVIVAEP